jgi:hypothetical protein
MRMTGALLACLAIALVLAGGSIKGLLEIDENVSFDDWPSPPAAPRETLYLPDPPEKRRTGPAETPGSGQKREPRG